MANGQLIADRSPSAAGPKPFYRINVIDNGDGTCTIYFEDRANSDGVSTAAAVPATGLKVVGLPAGGVSGSGTTNTLPIWTNGPGSVLGDSVASQNTGNFAIATPNKAASMGDVSSGIDGNGNQIIVDDSGNAIDIVCVGTTRIGDVDDSANHTSIAVIDSGKTITLKSVGTVFMGDTGSEGNDTTILVDDVNQVVTITAPSAVFTGIPQLTQGGFNIGAVNVFKIIGIPNNDSSLFIGDGAGLAATGLENCGVGGFALGNLTSGTDNTAVGFGCATSNTTGSLNVAMGVFALFTNQAGNRNVAIGHTALNGWNAAVDGDNVAVGYRALVGATTSRFNTGIGAGALSSVTTGQQHTAVGQNAGGSVTTNSGGVFIGYQAGANETGADKLYIANSNTPTPLIGGDFAANTLAFNAVVNVASQTATPAHGSTSARLLFGTTAGFGIYYGSDTPTVSAAQGSLYLRSDGTGANDRAYINTDGGTTWTPIVTVG